MKHLSKQPRPQYLEAQTECTRTGSDKAQASDLPPSLHPHPSPGATASAQGRQALLPSRGRGFTGPLAVPSRVCFLQLQTQGECAHPGKDTCPGSDTVTCTH